MKKENGVTLVSLIVTVIVLIILSSISINSGLDTIRYSKYNEAKSEIEYIQSTVNSWYTEYSNLKGDTSKTKEQKQKEYIQEHGVSTGDSSCNQTALIKTLEENSLIVNDFVFLSKNYLKNNLGVDFNFEFLVDIPNRRVILFDGIEYNGKTFYTAGDFDITNVESIYPVDFITFDLEKRDANKEIIIKNVVFKDSRNHTIDVSKFNVDYSIEGTDEWNNANRDLTEFKENGNSKYKFPVNEAEIYNVRISTPDRKIISESKVIRIVELSYAQEEIDFTDNHMVNTEIKLFNEENRNKDFVIRFRIDEYGSNVTNNTIVNARKEENTSVYPGLSFRCSGTDKYQFTFTVNSTKKATVTYNASELVHNETTISRINNAIYIQAIGGPRNLVIDLKNVDTTQFYNEVEDVVLTLGAALKNGAEQNYFAGKISIVEIKVFDHIDTRKIERELYVATENLVFDKDASKVLVFDGTNDLPEIKFFTAENINKDFEIKIKVDSFGANSYTKQDTILSTKLEVKGQTVVVPGFVFRRTDANNFEIKGSSNAYSKTSNSTMLGKTVTIKRVDGVYTAQIGDGTPKEFNTTATQQNDTPLVVGALKYTNGELDRMVNCVISELSIKIYDEVSMD